MVNTRNKITNFKDLVVWQESHQLCLEIYKLTNKFPQAEIYSLTSQLRRASSSIPTNIVEGFYRNTGKELVQFLFNSRGSCGEVIYLLLLSKDLDYIDNSNYERLNSEYVILIKRITTMIKGLRISMKNHEPQTTN